jgi:hypothetical protein
MMMSSKKQAKWGDVSMSRYDPETVYGTNIVQFAVHKKVEAGDTPNPIRLRLRGPMVADVGPRLK